MADISQPCPRFPSKIQHRTREDALEHQKRLVFADASVGHPDKSQGLHVYPCPYCGAWHVGHDERLPLVWHYTTCSVLDAILDSGALEPSKPRAFVNADLLLDEDDVELLEGSFHIAAIPLSRTFQNRYRGRLPNMVDVPIPHSNRRVRTSREMVEREQLLWFSRNEFWEHSVDEPTREFLEIHGEGLLRFGAPPSVAKLRWFDYLTRNQTASVLRQYFAGRADPTEWLATDEPVPLDKMKRIEVYYGGAWAAIDQVDDEAFERYLAERPAAYEAAHQTVIEKMDCWKAALDPSGGDETGQQATRHDDLLRYFDKMARDLHLTEAERIVFEDRFYMAAQFSRKRQG